MHIRLKKRRMKAGEILKKNGLSKTGCRENIIELLFSSDSPLSEKEIKANLLTSYDRTTFYRSFKTLVDKRILKRIIVDAHDVRYTIGNSITGEIEHIYFYCVNCKKVVCLQDQPVPEVKLPQGFVELERKFTVRGTCSDCNK